MSKIFPVTHSILSTSALITEFLPEYAIETPTDCRFLQPGLNDTFLVITPTAKYILRVYRHNWRSIDEILYELDALLYLKNAGVNVSVPIMRKDGNLIGSIVAPEGLRYVVLFTYAHGKEPDYETEKEREAYIYGKAVAKIHAATDTFQSNHHRFTINLEYLLDIPLRSIQPFLAHRPEDWKYLTRLATKLKTQILDLSLNNLELGFCHGDFHSGNAHLVGGASPLENRNEQITFFDFDSCAMGWRSYDIANFRWNARLNKKEKEMWPSFLHGYTEERHLSEIDIQATQYFVPIRHVWLLGLHTSNGQDWGFSWINDGYFDRALKFFREWETEYLNE
ncbi:phosphotransferase [Chamaesiphon sp. VAR_69_metabat_338]|uniref:phosphotransferase enzyme family protein n=1 Tax=Chamaesiphon sp. VAR_69_metabat_338 TaxID=2964704 RepID=UPI00286E5C5A|nr:phosphotransferase [Chamaesiphon sp. VAR_69_metabat_338]